jgi:predicted PurR-regulated permease PerM
MTIHTSQLSRTANGLFILLAIGFLLYVGAFVLVPLMWGVFLSFAIYPLTNGLEKKGLPRSLSIITVLIMVTTIFVAVLSLLFSQVISLLGDIPEIGIKLQQKTLQFSLAVNETFGSQFSIATIGEWDFWKNMDLNKTVMEAGRSLIMIGVIPLFIFLLLYYKDFFKVFLKKITVQNQDKVMVWVEDSGEVIQQYLVGIAKVTLIVFLLSGIYFYLIGIKYFLLFAVFIAVMNLIPYLGVILSSALILLYVLLTTDSMFYPVLTMLVLWGIQLTENNLITPVVVGAKVKVNALAVILAIFIGGALWGVSGMILFIPLAGIVRITLDRIPKYEAYGYLMGDVIPVAGKRWDLWSGILLLRSKADAIGQLKQKK